METTAIGCFPFRFGFGTAGGPWAEPSSELGTPAPVIRRVGGTERVTWYRRGTAPGPSAHPLQCGFEVGRQRRLRLDALAGDRVRKGQASRVQELAPQSGLRHAVDRVAGDRQADGGEMHADLVRAPRL